ncbi:hypothetical protein [Candidatus Odyssella thessalonicensis]|uniref:hypothetical protein n=1 Tax=Candidatus Odyssella thessalonicensis TaxID=84647 RepID=UPI0003126402|nr:hypothetical protein [Candidatus Odyssella thessalonicensis]
MTLKQEVANHEQFSSLIEELDKNCKMLCFPFHGNNKHPNVNEWEKYAYPLDTVQGKITHYVAYVPDVDYVNSSEVSSFERYHREKTKDISTLYK